MDDHILTLITLLHQLVIRMNRKDYTHKTLQQLQSPSKKILMLNPPITRFPSLSGVSKPMKIELTEEDRKLLEIMSKTRNTPGISKSQEFGKTSHRIPKSWSWSKSSESSPYAGAISSYKQHSGELHHTFFL